MEQQSTFDVIIVGGSYAGLSAAMSLGRSLRNVLIIDSGSPCNKQTPHSHNFITQDGEKPGVIAAKGKTQVLNYESVKYHNALVVSGTKTEKGFEVVTDIGEKFTAKKLIFATGIKDIMPEIVPNPLNWFLNCYPSSDFLSDSTEADRSFFEPF